jgi:internalin A
MFAISEPAKVKEALADLRALCERPEADRATIDAILAWMDVPPQEPSADKLAALRAWWPTVPEAAREELKKAIGLETEPGDADLARIALLDDLEVENSELVDLGWVTMLDRLEEIDLEGNKITDISPLAKLRRLRDLDISENRVMSLAPLAELSLERLTAGGNPLLNLSGLEQQHELSYLHVNEAGLETLEPLRGLRGLEDVTIYNNRITDLSPLGESKRIKEISSFGNPIEKGLAALGGLPWLESVDAGDETPAAEVKALKAANPLVKVDHFYNTDDDDEEAAEPEPDPELAAWWTALPAAWKKGLESELDSDQRGKKNPSLESLRDLVQEDHISIDDQPLPDLEPMRRFDRADFLNFGNTGITDLSPLSRLPRLRELIVRDNKIDLASVAPAKHLEELYIERCGLTSLAGIAGCRELREIYAEDNHVADLSPLAELGELRILDLEGNRIVDLAPLAKLSHLHTLKLGLNQVVEVAPLARCRALRVIELWANPTLSGGLALADLPDLRRLVTHGSLPKADVAELRRRRPDVVID